MIRRGCGAFVMILLSTSQAHAAVAASYVNVPEIYTQVARSHGIPATLLYAIALAESGKHVTRLNATRPWPWTLNIEGEGRYFPNRQAAIDAGHRALSTGARSVDMGRMQVNWRYHEAALRSVESAIDPFDNLQVGARILTDCYQTRRDWWDAVGCYHSPANPERAARYSGRVRQIWLRVQDAN